MRLHTLVPLALLAAAACSDGGTPTAAVTRDPSTPRAAGASVSGAIFTTNLACGGTNINIFSAKADVYLDGGPAHPGAAGLPPGDYYVKVTEPDGTMLGSSLPDKPVQVDATGNFAACYQLADIVYLASDNSTKGFDNTTNPGGEYKVWVSTDPAFDPSASKTDNFKVKESDTPPPPTWLHVRKFYDANANGQNDDGQLITGWQMRIQDGFDIIRYTPVDIQVAPDDYLVTESLPVETNWFRTTANPVGITLAEGDDATITFGNVCTGAGGGLTLGFWSNKNGQAQVGAADMAMLVALNLRNASGTPFDPATYAAFRTWILSASATNMAYMLSAQLAAMELNVFNGNVNGGALIYAPGTTSANALGFATVNAVMAEADASLGTDGYTVAAGTTRTYQEALKNALDRANNNLNFVQATPCAFTFAP